MACTLQYAASFTGTAWRPSEWIYEQVVSMIQAVRSTSLKGATALSHQRPVRQRFSHESTDY
ncbi:hypothetical protein GCM10008957_53600 [Deinococcus ruber]|uniref:Uncharacterized protein n=1 Tax=Deinococcus ruber TaxID=1848197 RepID=A0A918FH61_9DEIO|nr:hypothetical protein GCM10008957_53600 [Deinococcus ruber]